MSTKDKIKYLVTIIIIVTFVTGALYLISTDALDHPETHLNYSLDTSSNHTRHYDL